MRMRVRRRVDTPLLPRAALVTLDRMTVQRILDEVASFDGALVQTPDAASGGPEIAWGDSFCYYAPDGRLPHNVQPYATIVTKDYPGDTASRLGGDRWRVNIHVRRRTFAELTGETPQDIAPRDFCAEDVFLPHPVYGSLSWVAVVNPAERTLPRVLELLRDAHDDARRRAERRPGRADA